MLRTIHNHFPRKTELEYREFKVIYLIFVPSLKIQFGVENEEGEKEDTPSIYFNQLTVAHICNWNTVSDNSFKALYKRRTHSFGLFIPWLNYYEFQTYMCFFCHFEVSYYLQVTAPLVFQREISTHCHIRVVGFASIQD